MTIIGLTLIAVAWIIQLVSTTNENHKMHLLFAGLYTIGVLLLVIDGYLTGATTIASLNLISLVGSAFVFLKLKKIV